MKRIYQLSFVLLITLLFSQCDDSEKLSKPHLSLAELQTKVTTSEVFINFRVTTVQNHTNSINHISELNKKDLQTLGNFVEKYGDVEDFTKNATKEELDEFAELTKIIEVENTQRDLQAFDSYIDKLKRDFDFSKENLSLVILEGLFDEMEIIKNQRMTCKNFCTAGAVGTYNKVYQQNINHGTSLSTADLYATIASKWYFTGCLDGCGSGAIQ